MLRESRYKVRLRDQHKWTDIPVGRNSAARINLFATLDLLFQSSHVNASDRKENQILWSKSARNSVLFF